MKPDEQQTSGSYIGRILIDGATPFLYRSAVRSLLGLPENRIGNSLNKQNLPPTGFRYAYPQWSAGLNLEGTYRDPLNPVTPHPQSEPFEQQMEGSDKVPNGKEILNIPQSQTPRKKHPNNHKVENAAVSVDKSQVNIPGITTRKQHYPVITPIHNDEAQREVLLEENTLPNRKTVTSTGFPGVADQNKSVPDDGVIRKKMSDENETGDYAPVSRIIKDQRFPDRVIFSSENNNRLLSDFRIPVDSLPITGEVAVNPIEHSKALVINRELMQKMVYRTNKDNTKQLEQLKHTVNDLVDKNSELESQIRKNRAQTEKQQRNVPSPSQEPIKVEQLAKVSQTPSAFWERSYLSRFHLKMLR